MAAAVAELVVKVVTDVSKAKGLDETSTKTSKFASGLASASKVAAGALVVVGGAAISAAKAAAEDAASQDALAQSMKKNTGATSSQIAATEDWIDAQSRATGITDDELRPALANLVRATGDVQKSQESLSVAMDVSAATGKPLGSITEAMAKGFAGTTTSLGRLVPGLSKAALKSGDMGRIMDELKDKTGGAAKAAGETAAGQMKRFNVALGETQEAAGAVLLPALLKLSGVLVKVGQWAQDHGTLFAVIAGGVAALAVAVIALNVAMTVYTAVTTLAGSATLAAWAAALGPILLVVVAIAAVVAVVVILWKKSETFRRIVLGTWNAIKVAASAVAAVVKAVWRAAWAALTAYVRAYVTVFRVAFAVVRTVANAVASIVKAIWRATWTAITGYVRAFVGSFRVILSAVRSASSSIASGIRSTWSGVWNALESAAKTAGRVLSAPFDSVKSVIEAVIRTVGDLISALGRIHVPKISLPHVPGFSSTAGAVPSAAGGGVGLFAAPTVPRSRASSSGSSGGLVINVNGALDPEAVAQQIRRILGDHDRRVGGSAA